MYRDFLEVGTKNFFSQIEFQSNNGNVHQVDLRGARRNSLRTSLLVS